MDHFSLKPLQVFCPNCGHLLQGYLNEDGSCKIDCTRCYVTLRSKKIKKGFTLKVEQN